MTRKPTTEMKLTWTHRGTTDTPLQCLSINDGVPGRLTGTCLKAQIHMKLSGAVLLLSLPTRSTSKAPTTFRTLELFLLLHPLL